MNMFSPFNNLSSNTNKFNNNKLTEFINIFKRKKEDCPDDEDCSEMTSPCCNLEVNLVFGSLPLMVKCSGCGNEIPIKDALKD